jgi:secondary thiamine-phosphate synthase enzyme
LRYSLTKSGLYIEIGLIVHMILCQKKHSFTTVGRGFVQITSDLQDAVAQSAIQTGLCHCFIHHTSASLVITENADPEVLVDLENFMSRLVPDGDPRYHHDAEGEDDMPAHIRSVLTQTEISIPINQGRLALGTWQGVYLWEHRTHQHLRNLTQTIQGE